MSRYLFVFDLDGTTLDNQKKLPPPIATKINEMQSKHIIAFASGRPLLLINQTAFFAHRIDTKEPGTNDEAPPLDTQKTDRS